MQIIFELPYRGIDPLRLCLAISELQRPKGTHFTPRELMAAESMLGSEAWHAIWFGDYFNTKTYKFFDGGCVLCIPSISTQIPLINCFGING